MIQQILSTLLGVAIGSPIGAYLGAKIVKRDLKNEISGYIMNDLPHLLKSEEFKEQARGLARVFFSELIDVVSEELKKRAKEAMNK